MVPTNRRTLSIDDVRFSIWKTADFDFDHGLEEVIKNSLLFKQKTTNLFLVAIRGVFSSSIILIYAIAVDIYNNYQLIKISLSGYGQP